MAEVVIGVSGFICAVIIGPRFKDENGKFRPSMLKFLNVLLMFASGCLSGDAILHLIPHAFENVALLTGGEEEDHDDHRFLEEDKHEEHDHSGGLKIGLAITAGYVSYMIFENVAKSFGLNHSHGAEGDHNKVNVVKIP